MSISETRVEQIFSIIGEKYANCASSLREHYADKQEELEAIQAKLKEAEKLLYWVMYTGELWKDHNELHKKIEQFLVD